jgi:hypothetical protein
VRFAAVARAASGVYCVRLWLWEATMNDPVQKLESTASELLREAARRSGAAATEYGKLLTAYGRGDTDAADLMKSWFNFSAEEARSLAESAFRWSVEYYKWALGTAGIKVPATATSQGEPSHHSASAKSKR